MSRSNTKMRFKKIQKMIPLCSTQHNPPTGGFPALLQKLTTLQNTALRDRRVTFHTIMIIDSSHRGNQFEWLAHNLVGVNVEILHQQSRL